MRKVLFLSVALAVLLSIPITTQAVPFGFYNITNNNPIDAAIGEAQLWVDVTEYGTGQVLFTFNNAGEDACSITGVYFDDGSLLGIASIINGDGVLFSQFATPSNLPGGNDIVPPFATTAGFLADSDPAVQPNGVNPGEYLGIVFDLQEGRSFNDIFAQLQSTELRIGIHVQGFDTEGSESFVNSPAPIPEPATMLLLGSGLVGLVGFGRKKLFKS